jgi:hypothetical protein
LQGVPPVLMGVLLLFFVGFGLKYRSAGLDRSGPFLRGHGIVLDR